MNLGKAKTKHLDFQEVLSCFSSLTVSAAALVASLDVLATKVNFFRDMHYDGDFSLGFQQVQDLQAKNTWYTTNRLSEFTEEEKPMLVVSRLVVTGFRIG